jgi:hypothetical protein
MITSDMTRVDRRNVHIFYREIANYFLGQREAHSSLIG